MGSTFLEEQERILKEGWIGDAFEKIKNKASGTITKIKDWITGKASDLLKFLGFKIGEQVIEYPVPPLSNKFEKGKALKEQKEHLTNTEVSYTMLVEMIENLMSKE